MPQPKLLYKETLKTIGGNRVFDIMNMGQGSYSVGIDSNGRDVWVDYGSVDFLIDENNKEVPVCTLWQDHFSS